MVKIVHAAKLILGILFTLASINLFGQKTISVYHEKGSPTLDFALNDLRDDLSVQGVFILSTKLVDADVLLFTQSGLTKLKSEGVGYPEIDFDLKPEGFAIKNSKKDKIWVIGADEPGLMYGVFELAEQIRLYGIDNVMETKQNPYMSTRGVKFNIPLDVRTPTYTDPSEACQQAIPEMWSMDFWTAYIDELARDRYNMISLWSLHPFPSMIKVPEYPDVALDDVRRTTTPIDRFWAIGNGVKYPEILENTELVKKMTIEEKIEHWQKVMWYAKERNIDFYVMVWNVFDFGIDGKYGITEKPDNPITKDYFRKSVKQMLLTYPDLGGIGLTVGENMAGYPSDVKEGWAFDTYGKGILDALELFPDRKITFIHRLHQGDVQEIDNRFAPLIENKNVNFIFSFKYAQAHIMSSINQPYADEFVKEIQGRKTLWTLRNDDNYYFRWGAPGFLREFIKNIPYDVSEGFYYGSDGYVWGREFLAKNPKIPRELEVKKHWYHWMSMGRLGYDPDLTNQRFADILQHRFPEIEGKLLFTAWQEASMIYPVTTGFHWGVADFSWYIEGNMSRKGHPTASIDGLGIHHVDQFIQQEVHPGTNNQTIPDYVEMVALGETSELTSPLKISRQLHEHTDKALEILNSLDQIENKELSNTVEDIKSISFLGKYYAHKISGTTHVAMYRKTKDKEYQKEAVKQLEMALDFWQKYTENAMKQYVNPIWMKRVGMADWVKFTEYAQKDIEIAKQELKK
ncbi:MAG: hypothetical protein WBG90_16740 [Saonia sp.]